MTTALFLLRCIEIGISVRDLDLLTIGMVLDIWTEKANDDVKYDRVASQEDFDKFLVDLSYIYKTHDLVVWAILNYFKHRPL